MRLFKSIVPCLLLLTLTTSACQGASPGATSTPDGLRDLATETAQTSLPVSPEGSREDSSAPVKAEPVPRELVEKSRADLADRYGINPDLIGVAEARAVDWPDASLGCPQPGMAYAAVITPGYWILLETKDQSYPYHTDLAENVILCESDPEFGGARMKNDGNVVDGWPNQTKDEDVIIVTPTPRK
jgi:hypothetical protein